LKDLHDGAFGFVKEDLFRTRRAAAPRATRRRAMSASSATLRARPVRQRLATVMPSLIEPMLATSGELPANPANYAFEYKWDGVRALCFHNGAARRGSATVLRSRNLLDITARYPELTGLYAALGKHQAILDGEIIALDEQGRPSFGQLQQRMHVSNLHALPRLMRQVPVWYVLFDLLHLDGRSLVNESYATRRRLLEGLKLKGAHWHLTPSILGEGAAMLRSARENHLEGIVAKTVGGVYEPGRRSASWIKIKIVQRQEFVIGGWIPEGGANHHRIGALLLGCYDEDRRLHFAGSVGTGFKAADHAALTMALQALARPHSPFASRVPKAGAVFVQPKLVAEVEYRRWPASGQVQQASYKGLREDKPARAVVRERSA
jgi:bifunctional non-homologous end joining protein LigD